MSGIPEYHVPAISGRERDGRGYADLSASPPHGVVASPNPLAQGHDTRTSRENRFGSGLSVTDRLQTQAIRGSTKRGLAPGKIRGLVE